ncbi:cytochrome c [Changchengzhania lutea]|uniref:cytochrome c n=1 Tax=Changchengzhania lutea TaxID=2049305 RepID=UPI00115E55D1|nr:cytochrome c [Changchengzhania lutea]
MKTTYKILTGAMTILVMGLTITACSSSKNAYVNADTDDFKIEKSGAQYWGETCNRCHLAPSPADYNDTDWGTISLHMRIRANLTAMEINKIETFLKSAN